MITFTIAAEFRGLFFNHQPALYSLFFQCVWDTLRTFSLNDKNLNGLPGVISVLHTHSRALNYHPHIHAVMPNGAINKKSNLWRKKGSKYIFNHKALAKVFRAKMLDGIVQLGLQLPSKHPDKWNVDCQAVGEGEQALIYLGRYLYRGVTVLRHPCLLGISESLHVIREKDILKCENGMVTFRYKNSKTSQFVTQTISGADFLWLVIQHVLPKGFHRSNTSCSHGISPSMDVVVCETMEFCIQTAKKQYNSCNTYSK